MYKEIKELMALISYWKENGDGEKVLGLQILLKEKFTLLNSRLRKLYQDSYKEAMGE